MARPHSRLLLLVVLPLIAACTSSPSPQPVTPTATPESSPTTTIDCGPLAPDLCTGAVTVAEGSFPATHQPFISVQIESPTPTMTCPPSGGPPGSHLCGVIATVTTADGAVAAGLVRTDDGWVWSNLIR